MKDVGMLIDLFNKELENEGYLVGFKEKKIQKEIGRINRELFELYVDISHHINSLNTAAFTTLLILLDVEPITFSGEGSLDGMLNTARDF